MVMLSWSNLLFHDFPNKHKITHLRCHLAEILSKTESCARQSPLTTEGGLDGSTDKNDHARLAVILHYAVGDTVRGVSETMCLPGEHEPCISTVLPRRLFVTLHGEGNIWFHAALC